MTPSDFSWRIARREADIQQLLVELDLVDEELASAQPQPAHWRAGLRSIRKQLLHRLAELGVSSN